MTENRLTAIRMNRSSYTLLEKSPMGPVLSIIEREHVGAEISVLNELLLLDEAYRAYFKEWDRELELQRMAAEKLYPLTHEYCNQAGAYCRGPEPHPVDAEDLIITKYQLHYQIILGSNMALNRGVSAIRLNLLAFRREFHKLDMDEETAFICGDAFHKPIKFFLELADELFNFFYSHHLKLDCGARLLDPGDMNGLESYQKMISPCEEFEEYMLHNLSYCHCLRPQQQCPPRAKTQILTFDNVKDSQRRAKMSRCRRRLARMTHTRDASLENDEDDDDGGAESQDLEHEFRMNMLSSRLATLRDCSTGRKSGRERDLVQQMIYALSPSLMGPNFNVANIN